MHQTGGISRIPPILGRVQPVGGQCDVCVCVAFFLFGKGPSCRGRPFLSQATNERPPNVSERPPLSHASEASDLTNCAPSSHCAAGSVNTAKEKDTEKGATAVSDTSWTSTSAGAEWRARDDVRLSVTLLILAISIWGKFLRGAFLAVERINW